MAAQKSSRVNRRYKTKCVFRSIVITDSAGT